MTRCFIKVSYKINLNGASMKASSETDKARNRVEEKVQYYFSRFGFYNNLSDSIAYRVLKEMEEQDGDILLAIPDVAAGIVVVRTEIIRHMNEAYPDASPIIVEDYDIESLEADAIEKATKCFGYGSNTYRTSLVRMIASLKSELEKNEDGDFLRPIFYGSI